MATRTVWTAEDLARLPGNGRRYELIRGELVEMAPAGYEHGAVAFHIGLVLARHLPEP